MLSTQFLYMYIHIPSKPDKKAWPRKSNIRHPRTMYRLSPTKPNSRARSFLFTQTPFLPVIYGSQPFPHLRCSACMGVVSLIKHLAYVCLGMCCVFVAVRLHGIKIIRLSTHKSRPTDCRAHQSRQFRQSYDDATRS